MNKKTITAVAFVLMVIAQIYMPLDMILQREDVLTGGTEYKFRAAPIDPNDPFRGKYVNLSFADNSLQVPEATDWNYGDRVYVTPYTDTSGFARISALSKTEPEGSTDYFEATISYINRDSTITVFVQYPFDRFYMEESKAPAAEGIYRESTFDSTQVTYALVSVLNGMAVLRDVFINDESLREIAARPPADQG